MKLKYLSNEKSWPVLVFLILLLHFFFLAKLKFTAWPEMLTWPHLMINGWMPYRDIAIAHNPLMLLDLAFFYKIAGTGILQLQIYTWFLILVLDYFVFWIAKSLWNKRVALISLFVFVFIQVFYDGNGLWFDLFMGLAALISYYFVNKKDWMWAGVFWGLAFISKQTAFWFLIPIGLQIFGNFRSRSVKSISLVFMKGVFWVASPFTLIIWTLGILPDYFNWAIGFGIFELSRSPGQVQLPGIRNFFVSLFPLLIFIPVYFKTGFKNMNLLFWTLAGSMGALPRFEFFHFQPALPYLAIAFGMVFSDLKKSAKTLGVFTVFFFVTCAYLFFSFFLRNWKEDVRFYTPDVVRIAEYIKENTEVGEKIFVVNYWDNLYALTGTVPASRPWVPQLSWYMERSGIQEQIVSDLLETKPELIVFKPYSQFGLDSYIPYKIYDHISQNYELKEIVDGIEMLVPK